MRGKGIPADIYNSTQRDVQKKDPHLLDEVNGVEGSEMKRE